MDRNVVGWILNLWSFFDCHIYSILLLSKGTQGKDIKPQTLSNYSQSGLKVKILLISLYFVPLFLIFLILNLQKEKVKVYIDEKYHHAQDPSIRPPQKPKSLTASTENHLNFAATTAGMAQHNPSNPDPTSQMSTPKTTMRNANKPIRRQSVGGGLGNPLKSGANSRSSTLTRVNANTDESYGKDIKNIPKATWKLLTNKIYIVTCLVSVIGEVFRL